MIDYRSEMSARIRVQVSDGESESSGIEEGTSSRVVKTDCVNPG